VILKNDEVETGLARRINVNEWLSWRDPALRIYRSLA
jgi:hypothetical protein